MGRADTDRVSPWDPRDVVAAKRDGRTLDAGEIARFVQAYTTGEVNDYLAAAFLMAAFIRGLDAEETLALTRAMVDSGDTLADVSDRRSTSTRPGAWPTA